jgi:hypothetical protein
MVRVPADGRKVRQLYAAFATEACMQLAAGRETRITLAWKVSWPHDRVLHGL